MSSFLLSQLPATIPVLSSPPPLAFPLFPSSHCRSSPRPQGADTQASLPPVEKHLVERKASLMRGLACPRCLDDPGQLLEGGGICRPRAVRKQVFTCTHLNLSHSTLARTQTPGMVTARFHCSFTYKTLENSISLVGLHYDPEAKLSRDTG